MKKSMVVLLILMMLAITTPVSAGNRTPVGEAINLYTGYPTSFQAGTAFHIMHGWVMGPKDKWKGVYDFKLEVDGVYQRVDFLMKSPWDQDPTKEAWAWVYNFPNGMSAGSHTFIGHWFAPCQALLDDGIYPGPCPKHSEPIEQIRYLTVNFGPMQTPIIVDDDGSIDGVIALLYFLNNPAFDVRAVTISCGEAHPDLFSHHILRLLASLGRTDIPVGIGRDTPLEGNNAFPDPWRQNSDNFWGISLPEMTVSAEPVPASQLIIDTISVSTQPVMIFVSGNHTNLAEALRLKPSIAENILSINIMGGAIYVPGNIKSDWPAIDNSVAEWNIWIDPQAASEVFNSGLHLYLTPLDATNQVYFTQSDADSWASSGSQIGTYASEMLQWMLNHWYPNGAYVWDLVAAINTTNPELCPVTQLSVDINTQQGPNQGQTLVTDGLPNLSVCLHPELENINARSKTIFGN